MIKLLEVLLASWRGLHDARTASLIPYLTCHLARFTTDGDQQPASVMNPGGLPGVTCVTGCFQDRRRAFRHLRGGCSARQEAAREYPWDTPDDYPIGHATGTAGAAG